MSGYLLNTDKTKPWIPYFGNQNRFTNFIIECLRGLPLPSDFTFYETNAGSHAVSLEVRRNFQVETVSNDISSFAQAIGLALLGQQEWQGDKQNNQILTKRFGQGTLFTTIDEMTAGQLTSTDAAALGCMLMEKGGYDFVFDGTEQFNPSRYNYWRAFLVANSYDDPSSLVPRMDLYDFLREYSGEVVYMDFAWPWKDGAEVAEYGKIVDVVSSALIQKEESFELWTRDNVVENVLGACALAVKNFNFVILSNQSSNYPTWDVLEPALEGDSRFEVIAMRRLTMPAEDVDNRGIDQWFTEYQYILRHR